MPFMKGIAPIRRTTKYLSACPLVLKPRVKIMTVNFNDQGEKHHEGARDFVFWNLPQVQYKNPNVQIVTFKDMTPSPFITCFLEDNSKIYFDVDSHTNKEIMDRLVKTVGKTKEVLEEEAIASEAKSNPANFCRRLGFDRHCICEMPGQVPCPSLVPVPRHWRGKWWNQGHRWEEDEYKMTVSGGTSRFVSKKLRKLRWRPKADSLQISTDMFATGTWDDESNEVCLWKTKSNGEADLLSSVQHKGDVAGLCWLTAELLATASTSGHSTVYKVEHNKLIRAQEWADLHGRGGGTCVSAHGETISTAGEDGRVNILNVRQRNPVKVFDKADSCSINDLVFSKSSDLLTANMRGQMKLFDLRSNKQEPSMTYLLSNDQVSITCLAKHPSQGHIVMTGAESGLLAVWDLRQGKHPTTILSAHKSPISEVKFHPDQPDHIFTCSQGGELWHWDGSSIRWSAPGSASLTNNMSSTTSPWLSSEAVKHKVETSSLVSQQPLPINSLDLLGNSLLFGGDNEAFYILNNIVM